MLSAAEYRLSEEFQLANASKKCPTKRVFPRQIVTWHGQDFVPTVFRTPAWVC